MDSHHNFNISAVTVNNSENDSESYNYDLFARMDEVEEYNADQEEYSDDLEILDDYQHDIIDSPVVDLDSPEDDDPVLEFVSDDSTLAALSDSDEESKEPQTKKAKLDSEDTESESIEENESVDVTQKCSICWGAWTNVGEHRLCSLRCGHLFGFKCIEQWLNSDNESAKKCPQCNARASFRHIRYIYANKVTCSDYRLIEKLKKKVEKYNLEISQLTTALINQKKETTKYKQMYETKALAMFDSDLETD